MMAGRSRFWNPLGSLRYRLLALVLIPLLLLAITVVLFGARWTSDYTYRQLFTKVNTDLRVAHDSFERIQSDQQRNFRSFAQSNVVSKLFENPSTVNGWLSQQRGRYNLDYLMLLNADGTERLDDKGWQPHTLLVSPLTLFALSEISSPQGGTGIEIMSANVWERDGLLDPSQVVFPLIDTLRAAPSERSAEDRAMVIRSVQSIHNAEGDPIALLEGGRLLNRDFGFVDSIRDLVYGPGSLAPGSIGTVTVFLDDVRITTNVPSSDATRALGTRVSAEVRDTVLNQGKSWTDRAFVVNDWYISAYEPITDVYDNRVGMLYAGYLEAPFRHELYKAIGVLSALVLAGSLFAILFASLGARSLFRPIEKLISVVRATAAGERRRVGSVKSVDEIGELVAQLDKMLDTLEEQRYKIEQDAHVLEDKVQSRTAELSQQNQRLTDSLNMLQQTRQQLEAAEKLAALGELTAGVAHEINNPTAVILGNMDILISEMGDSRPDVQTEIDLIIQQVYRIRSITHRLVQYSRSESEQLSPVANAVSLPEVVSDTVDLIWHDFVDDSIDIRESHRCEQMASIDKHELQQVLVNLVRNAVEAVAWNKEPGQVLIETLDVDDQYVSIVVSDNGCGIDPSHTARLFDPFFTFGKERGAGLGLSVSYGIVRRYGGRIDVSSKVGVGSIFTVVLAIAANDFETTCKKPIDSTKHFSSNSYPNSSRDTSTDSPEDAPIKTATAFDSVLAEFKN